MEITQKTETQITLETHLLKRYLYLYDYWLSLVFVILFVGVWVLIDYFSSIMVEFPLDLCLITVGITIVFLLIRYRNLPLTTEYNFDTAADILRVTTRIVNWSTDKTLTLDKIENVELVRKKQRSILGVKRKGKVIWLSKSSYETAEKLSSFLQLPLHFEIDEDRIIRFPDMSSLQEPRTFALSCSKCGGQLPMITANDQQTKCEFCGTVSRIEWK